MHQCGVIRSLSTEQEEFHSDAILAEARRGG